MGPFVQKFWPQAPNRFPKEAQAWAKGAHEPIGAILLAEQRNGLVKLHGRRKVEALLGVCTAVVYL